MHLIWENFIKNLVLLWTGDFKGLDEGNGKYELAKAIWEAITSRTSSATDTIPSAYGSRVPNITKDRPNVSAEMWSFWTLYPGPVLLCRCLQNQKYYIHFIQLVQLLNICLQFEISATKIEQVGVGFNDWVHSYEEFYFQHDVLRLPICPLTIHALLHVALSITFTRPVWCYWAFPIQRYCDSLQPGIHSRQFPWASMDCYVMENVQLTQIMAVYNASVELPLLEPHYEIPGSFRDPNYDGCVLLPTKSPLRPDATQLKTIAVALSTHLDATMKIVNTALQDALVEEWGKVCHVDSEEGDTMRSCSLGTTVEDGRDSTHVRYEMLVDKYAQFKRRVPEYELQTFYGQLTHIYQVHFSMPCPQLEIDEPTTYIFGAIWACSLEADDPQLQKLDIHTYSRYGAIDVIDITSVQALVGRVPVKDNEWVVIDRSGALAHAHWADDDGH
ncbi:hypothetical protein C8R43DRAFT_893149 [Mycena crocata]|nr:hypothetical protein C8R43DRAFT_893149 [Mycena crocata]